ncbi:MAG: hypothetical protein RR382_00025 [Tannerellaceae bacterium]
MTPEKSKELALCISRKTFEENKDSVALSRMINTAASTALVPRGECEDVTKGWLQIIPYCVVFTKKGILIYKRSTAGSEDRLHDQYSIGVGGHIDAADCVTRDNTTCPFDSVIRAAVRELGEEVPAFLLHDGKRKASCSVIGPVGIVQLNESDVDKVHVGVILLVPTIGDVLSDGTEDCLADAKLVPFEKIEEEYGDKLETWSVETMKVLAEVFERDPIQDILKAAEESFSNVSAVDADTSK